MILKAQLVYRETLVQENQFPKSLWVALGVLLGSRAATPAHTGSKISIASQRPIPPSLAASSRATAEVPTHHPRCAQGIPTAAMSPLWVAGNCHKMHGTWSVQKDPDSWVAL